MTEVSVEPKATFDRLRAFGVSEERLHDLASSLQRLFAALEEAWRAAALHIQAIGDAMDRLRAAPRIEGYEEHLVRNRLAPWEAQIMTQITIRLGFKYRAEKIANRKLARAIGEVARSAAATTLVVSRRAKLIAEALQDGMALHHLQEAFLAAGIADEES